MLGLSALRFVHCRHRTARISREQLVERNLARFRELVAFVKERSPYYREIIAARAIDPARAVPEDFPVLTKRRLIDNFDRIATDRRVGKQAITDFLAGSHDPRDLFARDFVVVHTSGTSGELSYSAYRRSEWLRGASQLERLKRIGWRKRVALVGATHGHFVGASMAMVNASPLRPLAYVGRAISVNQPTRAIVAQLNQFQPEMLVGYARVLRTLAEARLRGSLKISPGKIVAGGEPMLRRDRQFLEQHWPVHLRSIYAVSEHLVMGLDVPGDRTMYLIEDDLIIDLRADCTLVTNLFNRTVPLIRHRLDDVLRPLERTHGPYRVVEAVIGRYEDAPVFFNEDGEEDSIHPIVIVEFYAPHLQAFQMERLDSSSFRFRVVLENGAPREAVIADVGQRLRRILAEKRMANVRFEVEPVDGLERDPRTGKFRLIVGAA